MAAAAPRSSFSAITLGSSGLTQLEPEKKKSLYNMPRNNTLWEKYKRHQIPKVFLRKFSGTSEFTQCLVVNISYTSHELSLRNQSISFRIRPTFSNAALVYHNASYFRVGLELRLRQKAEMTTWPCLSFICRSLFSVSQ